MLKLPIFPLIVNKGEQLLIPVSVKVSSTTGQEVKFKLELILGPVPDFVLSLKIKYYQ